MSVPEKAARFSYREIAHAEVREVLKGNLPMQVNLYGNETFICAQVRFAPGRHLVFLRRKGGLLVGSNWHFSVRPVKGECGETMTEWYVPGERWGLSWQPMDEVLERIRDSLSERE